MKIIRYSKIIPVHFASRETKGVAGRVAIGRDDGADGFCMRVFEIAPGGNTPKHLHDWEHEMFVHSGEGEVYGNGRWNPIKSGDVVFIQGCEEHQIRNTGQELLAIVCVIPAGIPEL